ncbi:MAG: BamA/TamA family outer membrane protein [Candidatus Aegiribacteria sp.]|nr:BamA/TamA family outer membrane protein [Candidatus Aegiribacteria sp.]MBD3294565.1 BamA/TamA family outer membrane protein [Candidatus Fermentibacteria bacterium]
MVSRTLTAVLAILLSVSYPALAWKVFPVLSYSSSSGFLFGGVVNHNMLPPFRPVAFSTMSYIYTDGSFHASPLLLIPAGNDIIEMRLSYDAKRENEFYGWGNGGSHDVSAGYSAEVQELLLSWNTSLVRDLALSAGVSVNHSTVYDRESSSLWQQSPIRSFESTWTAGPFAEAVLNLPGCLDGYLSSAVNVQTDGDFVYSKTEAAAALFMPLGNSTLPASRVRIVKHSGSDSTPFSFLPSLGGSSGLRGYADGRFRGDWALLANLELRQDILSLRLDSENVFELSLVLFGDAGQVADHLSDCRWDRFHLDGGIGARMTLPGGGSLRADFAMSPEGLGIQMGLGELF